MEEIEMNSVQEMANEWHISKRRVQELCKSGKVMGAMRFGNSWMIPKGHPKPIDGRLKDAKKQEASFQSLPIRCPMLTMTKIYNQPGKAQKVSRNLKSNPVAKALFDAEINYFKGNITEVEHYVNTFSFDYMGINAYLGTCILKSFLAVWYGDIDMWNEAKRLTSQAPIIANEETEIVSLAHAILNIAAYHQDGFPEWFNRGTFESLPSHTHPLAKVSYALLMYITATNVASKQFEIDGVRGLAYMRIVPHLLEPLISQSIVDQTVVVEAYLRLICAIVYHDGDEDALAIKHIDQAIQICLQDKLYLLLAEHWRLLDNLLEDRLLLIDINATKIVRELAKQYNAGLTKLRANIRNSHAGLNLTNREREVVKYISFGFKNKQIAKRLNVSDETIKSTIQNIMQKTGLTDRADFASLL